MDRVGHWTNHNQLPDQIAIFANPKRAKSASIADLYLKQGLTVNKLAARVGLSRSTTLRKLHDAGVRRDTFNDHDKVGLRPFNRALFGKRIVDGRMMDNLRELKIARLIVELRDRQGLPWKDVVAQVNRKGMRTRTGLRWKVGTASAVYLQWKGKI